VRIVRAPPPALGRRQGAHPPSRRSGRAHKKRYLRHADGEVSDGYGVCTLDELARAMTDLLGFEHPLVHGIEERRRDTMRRLGLPDQWPQFRGTNPLISVR
jgi:hypothetical protein